MDDLTKTPDYDINPKMRIFADEWLTGEHTGKPFNLRVAADYAGYATPETNPSTVGSRLMRHPKVKAYVKARLEELSMSTEELLMRFTEIARSEVGEVVTTDATGKYLQIDPSAVLKMKKMIKNFSFDSNGNPKIEFHDSYQALRDLARARGLFKDGLELSGPGGGAVPVAMTVRFVNPDGSQVGGVQEETPLLPAGNDEDWSDLE